MKNTFLAYNNHNGSLLLAFNPESYDCKKYEEQLVSEGISSCTVELELTSDVFLYQEAFSLENKQVVFKFPERAKRIHIEKWRHVRVPLLTALDLEYMRADEAGNTELKKEIAANKQALRDVTKTELPNTLEGIKSTWPEILGPNPFNK